MGSVERGVAARVSVPVTGDVAEAVKHPERIGLPKDTSAAKVLSYAASVGVARVRQDALERAELAAYAEYAHDPDAEASVLALQEAAVAGRVL